jgi:hypothetical protein
VHGKQLNLLSITLSPAGTCPRWQGLRKGNFMAKTNNQILLEYLQAGNVVTTRNAPD